MSWQAGHGWFHLLSLLEPDIQVATSTRAGGSAENTARAMTEAARQLHEALEGTAEALSPLEGLAAEIVGRSAPRLLCFMRTRGVCVELLSESSGSVRSGR